MYNLQPSHLTGVPASEGQAGSHKASQEFVRPTPPGRRPSSPRSPCGSSPGPKAVASFCLQALKRRRRVRRPPRRYLYRPAASADTSTCHTSHVPVRGEDPGGVACRRHAHPPGRGRHANCAVKDIIKELGQFRVSSKKGKGPTRCSSIYIHNDCVARHCIGPPMPMTGPGEGLRSNAIRLPPPSPG